MTDYTKIRAGFHGKKDPLRSNAEKLFGRAEMGFRDKNIAPAPSSSVGREKMRPFKKGGTVGLEGRNELESAKSIGRYKSEKEFSKALPMGHYKSEKEFSKARPIERHKSTDEFEKARRSYKTGGHIHGLTKQQTDLYIPKRKKSTPFKQESMAKATSNYKTGGAVRSRDSQGRFAKGGYADGGGIEMPKPTMKRGGKTSQNEYGWGGAVGQFVNKIPLIGGLTSMLGMKEGGSTKSKSKSKRGCK